ncbi:MAG: tetratricopeptide repeat protein [Verrucomicrobiia bacterium]
MCEENKQRSKPLASFGDFATTTTDTSKVEIRDITGQMVGSAIQITGGVQRPESIPRPSAVMACQQRTKGEEFYRRRDYENALKCFERAIEILSALGLRWQELADGWDGKGRASSKLGYHDDAIQAFDEAIAIEKELYAEEGGTFNETQGITLMHKSVALTNAGRFEEALAVANESVKAIERVAALGRHAAIFDLALALRGKGKALDGLHRSFEASACYQWVAELVTEEKPVRDEQGGSTEHES